MRGPVTLRIGRLVLTGVARGEASMLTAALRQELARRFAANPHSVMAEMRSRARIEAGPQASGATAAETGRTIAGAIHKAVTR